MPFVPWDEECKIETIAKGIELYAGDNRAALQTLADCSVDSIVTDPPYALVSIQKRFGKPGSAPVKVDDVNASNDLKAAYARASAGFMGKQWDTGETAFTVEFWAECLRVLKPGGHIVAFSGTRTYHRMTCAIEDAGFEVRDQIGWTYGSGFPKSHNIGDGWGTALKPAWEPICLGRKPVVGTVRENVAEHGVGAINVDACRVEAETPRGGIWKTDSEATAELRQSDKGRWPANIVHDGSEEVLEAFPETTAPGGFPAQGAQFGYGGGERKQRGERLQLDDGGNAARFFYTAKADADDRIGSKHPTVKPVDLMQWLVRLVTPKSGLVLDPFAGTGTTAEACFREGMRCVLMEREPEYIEDIRRRMSLMMAGPDERARESIKATLKDSPMDHGPLFAEVSRS